ncbi:MAG: cohesin domain-containing protein, partial [Fidelibacterota bacterium]
AGAYIHLNYDRNKLLLMTVNPGTFFSDLQDPMYFSDTQNSGEIELYTAFLGADSTSVSGTGSFMSIVFSASTSGLSTITYSTDCELVDSQDNNIEIKGFGQGVVNAQ